MRIAIVENTAITHHGQVGVALHEAAARIDLYKPWRDGILPDAGAHDALVVFGGEQSALDDATHPYLPRLARLMTDTGTSGIACLGICLGAQVQARGLGAQNHLARAREFGWCEVSLTAQGRADPVFATLPDRFPIFQWHSDTFTPPPATTPLATSTLAPQQCYRFGRAGYGMQFHFEANRAMVQDWSTTFAGLIRGIDPDWHAALPDRLATTGSRADAHGLTIARNWVRLI